MDVVHVNGENFEKVVLKEKLPVLLDFYAEWCGPCKMLTPVLISVCNEEPNVKVCKIDIDDNTSVELAKQYGVMSVPTMVFLKDGVEVERLVGLRQKSQIFQAIQKTADFVPDKKKK